MAAESKNLQRRMHSALIMSADAQQSMDAAAMKYAGDREFDGLEHRVDEMIDRMVRRCNFGKKEFRRSVKGTTASDDLVDEVSSTNGDSDDDEFEDCSDSEFDLQDEKDLDEYARVLLEFKESLDEEEQWVQEIEQRLMSEVSNSLATLRACQLAVAAHKPQLDTKNTTRKSSVKDVELARRESAASIRAQTLKAEKKVKRAKARELKARKALVQSLKKQHAEKRRRETAKEVEKRKWDDLKKNIEEEFDQSLEGIKLMMQHCPE